MVKDGGATLREVKVEGKGKLSATEEGGKWVWEVSGSAQRIPARLEGGSPEALLEQARSAAGKELSVSGLVTVPEEGDVELVIRVTEIR